MGLIDFHCHLDLYPDYIETFNDTEERGIYTLAVTTTPRAWTRNKELTKGMNYVQAALGIHPQLVKEDNNEELSMWDSYLSETRFIGEVGLDGSPQYISSFNEQKKVFEHILKNCAKEGNKILSVHSVRASNEVLNLIGKYLPHNKGKTVLHWFTGTTQDARKAVELGCYFSINAAMLKTKKGQQLIKIIPKGRILTETDGPFTKWENNPSRPQDVRNVINLLSNTTQVSPDRIADTILNNLKVLLT